ncbi:hypothetical protein IWW34DRAFT_620796 [Fusarium oxysporum f. sp. albedinis]|nr:hypothetical protein IWW34DRAFT_620796 [Fusarium oxysporum f. sp. albedinis]
MSISPAVQDLLDRNKAIVPQFQPLNLSLAAGTKPLPMVAVSIFIHADLQPRFPEADPAYIDSLPFRTIDSLEQSVRDDIQFIHNSVLVKKELKDLTVGFIVDINTGQLTQVQGIVADAPQ